MCDFSLQAFKSRAAVKDETLVTTNFGSGTRGFAAPEKCDEAVCIVPGTELAFEEEVRFYSPNGYYGEHDKLSHKTAIFRQVNKDNPHCHHDTLEFPDGHTMLLTFLAEGQRCRVLQLPAEPKNEAEKEEQRRVEVIG